MLLQKEIFDMQCDLRKRWSLRCSVFKRHSLLMSICCTPFQALTRACSSCWGVLGCGTWLLTCLSILSHRCSLGLRSRDIAGHGSTLMLFSAKKFWVTIAACGRALSCWNVTLFLCCWIKGTRCGWRILFMYKLAVRFPWTITKLLSPVAMMAPTPLHYACHWQCWL